MLRGASGNSGVVSPNGRVRARVTWTGGGTTITDSSNVTSITRNGDGDYTINVTNALPANAQWTYGMYEVSGTTVILSAAAAAPTTIALRLQSRNIAGAPVDAGIYWAQATG